MSSKSTTSYVAIVKLIEACGASGVKSIKVNDLEVEFHCGAAKSGTPAYTAESIDFGAVIGDNEQTDEDKSLSEEITLDAIEDLALSDPLQHEEIIKGMVNAQAD